METKHTQGEWESDDESNIMMTPIGAKGQGYKHLVVLEYETCFGNTPITTKEAEANAKLMATSPKLLKFAKLFSEILANGEMNIYANKGFNKKVAAMIRLNIEVIKKAT